MTKEQQEPYGSVKVTHFCPVTGLEVVTRPEWQDREIGDDYKVSYWIIGDSILYTRPVGNVNLQAIRSSLRTDDAVAAHIASGTGRYVQIEDYSQLHNVSIEARKYFIDYFNTNDRLAALFLCNLSHLMNIAIRIGKRFAFPGLPVFTGEPYCHAIKKALEICDAEGLPQGSFAFGRSLTYLGDGETLSPVVIASSPEWEFKTSEYASKSVVIDNDILLSTPEGQLQTEHVPLVDNIHNSVIRRAHFDYLIVDASKMSGIKSKSRLLLMKYMVNLHRDAPFRMYILFGANPLISTAVKMSRPFMPFTTAVARDLNEAFEIVRQDRLDRHQAPSIDPELDDHHIQRYVDDLLLFIGGINWEKEGIDPEIEDVAPDHPFGSVFRSVRLIKEELDDLTARRRESEQKYSNLFLYSKDCIFIHDMGGNILDVNNKALELFEYSKPEMLALNVLDLHPREALDNSHAAFEIISKEGFVNFEIEFETKTGKRFPGEVSSSIYEINGQKVVQALVRSIAQRKEAEAVLRNYRALVETMNDGMAIIDQQLSITYVNNALCRMTGFTAEEMVGRPAIDFLDKENQQRLEAEVVNWPQTDTPVFEIDWVGKDGRTLSSIVSPTPMLNEEGEFAGFMGIVTDVSDLKKARREKEQIQAQLYHSQKMEAIGTLAGGVAHDFNNYLTTILGCTDLMLLNKDNPEKLEKFIGDVRSAAERSAGLTRQLLAFSRRQVLEKKPVDLNHVVGRMEEMLQRLIGENIELQTALAPDLSRINADPAQMEQVFLNLAVNARDAMPGGGKLRIITENTRVDEFYSRQYTYARTGDFVCMTFEDNGSGMPPEVAENIFEPFFTTKTPSQGTGLGLAVVYGVVKQHGGWINVYSEPSRGTRFQVYLPAGKGPVDHAVEQASEDPGTGRHELKGIGQRILLVEDQQEVREMIVSVLQMQGYHVETAASISEAGDLIASGSERFDLLFSDVILPDGNGIDLAREITADHPNIKVLLSSGYTEEKARVDIIEENRFHFLQKPYPIEKMLKKISEALGR